MVRVVYLVSVVAVVVIIMWPFLEKLQEIAKAVQ